MLSDLPLPDAVLFDLGDTVLRQRLYKPAAGLQQVLRIVGVKDESRAGEFIARGVDVLDRALLDRDRSAKADAFLTETRMQSLLRLLLDMSGLKTSLSLEEIELAFWQGGARMAPTPGVAELLDLLATHRVRVAMISNTKFTAPVLRWELERNGLADKFELIVASCDYGIRKPSPELFHVALRALDVAPGRAWYCGDSLRNDVEGATAAGMVPIWYTSRSGRPDLAPCVCRVEHWDEIRERFTATG